MQDELRVLIYGAGAVGLGLGACLLRAGADVTFLGREDTVSALERNGLIFTGIFGEYEAPPGSYDACASLYDVDDGPFDFIMVTTKAHASNVAAEDIAGRLEILGDSGYVVLFHNGWGSADIFAALIPKERVLSARVITGFVREKPNEVECTVHADAIRLGSLFGEPPEGLSRLAEAISRGGIPCEVTGEVEKYLWAKLIYNCALNPTGAVFRVTYGELADSPHTREIMNSIIEECFAAMKAGGFSTFWGSPDEYLEVFYRDLVPPTASHVSSMVMDIKEGRKTEIDFISGAILRIAEEKRVDVPVNEVIYRMVKFLEGRRESRE